MKIETSYAEHIILIPYTKKSLQLKIWDKP